VSVVTGFVLTCALAEDIHRAEHPPGSIALIGEWLAARRLAAPAEVADRHASGDKHPQLYLYAAGYNHFPEDEFIAFFQTLAWQCPENVVLVLQPEQGPTRVVRPSSMGAA
jgi:hypothetical protein